MPNATKLIQQLKLADDKYYNSGAPVFSDVEYDKLKDKARKLDPDNSYFSHIGAPPRRNKTKLPIVMGSLAKFRPDDAKWLKALPANSEFYITPKLDGLAGLLHYRDGKLFRIYTRGDGIVGRDVSPIAKHVQGVRPSIANPIIIEPIKPSNKHIKIKSRKLPRNVYISVEFIIHNKIFKKYYAENTTGIDGKTFAHPRNFVVGMLNKLDLDKKHIQALKRMTAVAYGVTTAEKDKNEGEQKDKFGQLLDLNSWKFTTITNPSRHNAKGMKVIRERIKKGLMSVKCTDDFPHFKFDNKVSEFFYSKRTDVTPTLLRSLLSLFARKVDIVQDGLVIEVRQADIRKKLGFNGGLPEFARAVKLDPEEQKAQVGVIKEIEWNPSKRRIYKPTIVLTKPVIFDGVKITRITAHNAGTVKQGSLGPGGKIEIIRSGDVIPYYRKTTKPVMPRLPKLCFSCGKKLQWTDKKVDLFCGNPKCNVHERRNFEHFFNVVKVDGLSSKTVYDLIDHGYDTIPKLLQMNPQKLAKLERFGKTKSTKLVDGIRQAVADLPLHKLIYATNIMSDQIASLGSTKLEAICKKLGNNAVLNGDINKMLHNVENVEGIGPVGAQQFVKKLNEFRQFYRLVQNLVTIASSDKIRGGSTKLASVNACFTNFRDQKLEALIETQGGTVSGSVTSKVTVLFYGKPGSGKYNTAKMKGIECVHQSEAEQWLQKKLG